MIQFYSEQQAALWIHEQDYKIQCMDYGGIYQKDHKANIQ